MLQTNNINENGFLKFLKNTSGIEGRGRQRMLFSMKDSTYEFRHRFDLGVASKMQPQKHYSLGKEHLSAGLSSLFLAHALTFLPSTSGKEKRSKKKKEKKKTPPQKKHITKHQRSKQSLMVCIIFFFSLVKNLHRVCTIFKCSFKR